MEPLAAGDLVGNYRICSKLGEGGMGVVYLAEHLHIGRKAAVKVLLPQYSSSQEVVNRFFNEARATSLIKHPGIVDVFDYGHHPSGFSYIVMELLEGESLAARIARFGRLPWQDAARIGRDVARILAAAHENGVIHRDLKPDNIFLLPPALPDDTERVKILDFGIAKLTSEQAAHGKTRTGVILGTPAYMAPEQFRSSNRVDARADVYALGCVLFQLVCGRPPFQGEGYGDILTGHMLEAVPPFASLGGEAPFELEHLVGAMLRKEAAARTASMVEVATALDRLLSGIAAPVPPPSPTGGAPKLPGSRIAIALVFVAVTAVSAFLTLRIPRTGGFSVPPRVGFDAGSTIEPRIAGVPPAPDAAALPSPPIVVAAAAPVPETITVFFHSKPSGARVVRVFDEASLGNTPAQSTEQRAHGSLAVRFELSGYRPVTQVVTFPATPTVEVNVSLGRLISKASTRPAAPAPGRTPGTFIDDVFKQ